MSFSSITSRVRGIMLFQHGRAVSHQETVSRRSETPQVLERLTRSLVAEGFPHRDIFAVRLAVEEAIVNAIEHGNRGNPNKLVHIDYLFLRRSECLLITIQDFNKHGNSVTMCKRRSYLR
jgi:anti-sigma regulatory factor (Ser/Thr protein kinase)